MPLKTDYKNFIPSTTTKIHDIKQAGDETVLYEDVILEDVTIYSQEGDAFGSADINATNAQVNANTNAIALKAPLSSPEFTDIPKAPTAPTGTDTTQIASTEFVQQELDVHKADNVSPHPIYAKKAQDNWIDLTLQNGWLSYAADLKPQYRKDQFGKVEIRGQIKGGTVGSNTVTDSFGILPISYRPTRALRFASAGATAMNGIFAIQTGEMNVYFGDNTRVSLDGISFYLD